MNNPDSPSSTETTTAVAPEVAPPHPEETAVSVVELCEMTQATVAREPLPAAEESKLPEKSGSSHFKFFEPGPVLLPAITGLLRALALSTVYGIRSSFRYVLHHPIHMFVDLALITLLSLVVFTGVEINNQLILDRISDRTVDEVIKASRFGRNFSADDLERIGVRELVGVGAPEWMQRESVRAILYHARKAGLSVEDQAVLLAVADIESGFNPLARAPTTSACGLFQFVRYTGNSFQLPVEQCMNPWENARSGVEHYLFNYERRVQPFVNELSGAERVFKLFELSYYLHHDGPASNNPSNDVKATILSGTQFLFRAYHVLREEAQMPDRAPAFAEKFSSNFAKMTNAALDFYRTSTLHRYVFGGPGSGPEFGQ